MRRPKIKAIVLAAGKAERLKGLSLTSPKPMLTVDGEIILEHNLKWLKANGIEDVFINLHHLPDVIREYFADGRTRGFHIRYSFEKELLGTAGAVRKIITDYPEEFSSGTVAVIYGDNFYPSTYDLRAMMAVHEQNRRAVTIGLYPNRDVDNLRHCGVVFLEGGGRVKAFIEKPQTDIKNLDSYSKGTFSDGYLNAAIYLFDRNFLGAIPAGFSDFASDVFPKLLMDKTVPLHGYVFDKPLITVDTPELFQKASATAFYINTR